MAWERRSGTWGARKRKGGFGRIASIEQFSQHVGGAPKKYSTCHSAFKHKIQNISATEMIPSENSTDLGLGHRPIAKSDEFLEGIILIPKI